MALHLLPEATEKRSKVVARVLHMEYVPRITDKKNDRYKLGRIPYTGFSYILLI